MKVCDNREYQVERSKEQEERDLLKAELKKALPGLREVNNDLIAMARLNKLQRILKEHPCDASTFILSVVQSDIEKYKMTGFGLQGLSLNKGQKQDIELLVKKIKAFLEG